MAAFTRIAFSKFFSRQNLRDPQILANHFHNPATRLLREHSRRESTAGMAALCGNPSPSASTMLAMVDAVPMVMQCPAERDMHVSASMKSASAIFPRSNIVAHVATRRFRSRCAPGRENFR